MKIFLFLLLFSAVVSAKYWVVKVPKKSKKQDIRIEHHIGDQKYVIFSKNHPAFASAKEYSNKSLQLTNDTIVKTNKACYPKLLEQIAPQTFRLRKGDVLPSDCIVLDDYTATIKTVDLFATTSEITQIMDFVGYPEEIEPEQSTSLIIDSGLDTYHCFFYDDEGHVNYYSYTSSAITNIIAGTHSKIKAYIKYVFSDWTDTPNGHGTHTAGILAGLQCGLRRGVGINDKLVIMDVGLSTDTSQLYVPTNLIGKRNNKDE